MKTILLHIPDMNCASCVNHIQKDVGKMLGVEDITVNFASAKAQIRFDESKISTNDIIAQIKKTGYTAMISDEHMQHSGHDQGVQDSHHEHAAAESAQQIQKKLYKVIFGAISSAAIIGLSFFIDFNGEHYLMLGLALVTLIYTGNEFFIRGIPSLFKLRPDMDTLVSVGVGAAFLYSSYLVLFTDSMVEYFMDATIIATFIMLGRYLEAKAKGSASESIKKLLELSAKIAHLIKENGQTEDIPIEEVKVGDRLIIKPGEKIPVDGEIIKGEATIDESMVTGESIPTDKTVNDKVIGATINGNTSFTMVAQKVGKNTILSQMIKLVGEAQMSKAPIEKLVDKISSYFVWGVIFIAAGTFLVWNFWIGVEADLAFFYTITVLIIACPCALGLATPISIVVGSGKGASLGILIKKPESLEKTHKITAICFDKTGTITEGKPKVTDFLTEDDEILKYISTLEHASEHPLGKAIVDYAKLKNVSLLTQVENVKAHTGMGIEGKVEGKSVIIGNQKFLQANNIDLEIKLSQKADVLSSQGKTVLYIAIDKKHSGVIAIQDLAKESSKHAIALLHQRNIKTIMMTGDNQNVAQAIAREVGIDEVLAEVSPGIKLNKIKELKEKGEFVAMVGDGINDAPALAAADIGIAMGTGTDIAIESGDIVIVKGDLLKAVEAIELSKATYRNIKQNLFWAFIYNSIGIPIAAIGILNPIISAGAMAFSSVSVVLNSLRLKKFKHEKN